MNKLTKLIGMILMLALLFSIPAPALAAGRQEALYPGETVVLGAYEQDGIKNNGPEDIEWRVLEARGDCALLISQDILDAGRYHEKRTEVTWAECTLREWLNDDFYESAFSDEEQDAILTTAVDNSREQGNTGWRRAGGDETEDKVFLLSYAELREYFDSDQERTCKPSEYAAFKGVWTDKNGTSHWWMRSPGSSQYYSAYCSYEGKISSTWNTNDSVGVRPVIRVDLAAVEKLSQITAAEVTSDKNVDAADHPDFRIEDGVLIEYLGAGGEVTIPDDVTVIGAEAFSGCDSLTSITIPDSVVKIESGAFSGCSSLESVTIPDSVVKIGAWAFSECRSLEKIELPKQLFSIDNLTFYFCENLTDVSIPDSVVYLGFCAFTGCQKLKSITIPESVKAIGADAFSGCASLENVQLSDNVSEIGPRAFYETPWAEAETTKDGFLIVGSTLLEYSGDASEIAIPGSVTAIGESVFSGHDNLRSVVIPGSVKSIEKGAFMDCNNLEKVEIQNGVEWIGASAFFGTNLTSLTLPDSIATVGAYAFVGTPWFSAQRQQNDFIAAGNILLEYCGEERNVLIPDNTITIGDSAFSMNPFYDESEWADPTSVVIPESVRHIGSWAFEGCSNLKSLTIPDGITDFGYEAFSGTPWLEEQMEGTDSVIVNGVLIKYCGQDSEVEIPDGVSAIAGGAFVLDLTSVYIPSSVISVYDDSLPGYGISPNVYYDGALLATWYEQKYEGSVLIANFPGIVQVQRSAAS